MDQVQPTTGQPRQGFGWPALSSILARFLFLCAWILTWTVIFSAVDFWSIKQYDVCNLSWFQGYRAVMRYGASWVSPPSFALAENAYFVWMNMYDPDYQMHEWAWYSGNPTNPDGDFNFVWGDGNDGWIKFPMKEWYMAWLFPTGLWFLLLTFISKRKKAAVQRGIQIIPPRLMFFGLGDALRWLILRGVQEVPGLDQDL